LDLSIEVLKIFRCAERGNAMKTVGEKIRDQRIQLGMTQQQLADKTEISIRSICKYESEGVTPRGTNLYRLATELGVSVEYLSNPEIEDPNYGLEEAPYVDTVRSKYGKKGATDMMELLAANQAMFAGGDVPQEDKDLFFQAVMQAYLQTKQEAHDLFTPKKYKD